MQRAFILVYVLLMVTLIFSSVSLFQFLLKNAYKHNSSFISRYKFLYEALAIAKLSLAQVHTIEKFGIIRAKIPFETQITIHEREYFIKVEAEDAKLPIVFPNTHTEAIKSLLISKGINEKIARQIADIIIDFQDPDNLKRLSGAENEYYRKKGYFPPNKRLNSLQEVIWLKDIDFSLYKLIVNNFTVYSTKVNINFAPPEVLKAIGIPEGVVNTIIELRKRNALSLHKFHSLVNINSLKTPISLLNTPEVFRITIYEKNLREMVIFILDLNGNLKDVLWI